MYMEDGKPKWDYRVDIVAAAFNRFTCNYRCPYCHKDYFLQSIPPKTESYPLEYGISLCRRFLKGSFSIHLGGSGEPLLIPKEKFRDLVGPLVKLDGCSAISLTTNGYHLSNYVNLLVELGISDINVSIPCLNEEKHREVLKVTSGWPDDIVSKTLAGIVAARESNLNVDINVCVSYEIAPYLAEFIELSNRYGLRIKFFPVIAVPDLNVSSSSRYFCNLIEHLGKQGTPSVESIGRYLTLTWNLQDAHLCAKPGDVYIRPYECYQCIDFLRCEESCWRSVRISPWYIQPCGIRKDNIFWYNDDNPEYLYDSLVSGGKLPERNWSHKELIKKINEVIYKERIHPLIVVEGPDGSGKTRIAKELAKRLGYIYYRSPPQLYQKEDIKCALERTGLEFARYLYYMSSNYYGNLEICSLLVYGGVICDRWLLSTILYHDIALGFPVHLPQQVLEELIQPDLTIILDVSKDIQQQRLNNRELHFDQKWETSPQLMNSVNKKYQNVSGNTIFHVNNEKSIDEVVSNCILKIREIQISNK